MLDVLKPVRVYWNYKHRCYSLFQAGAVVGSAKQVLLADVALTVREGGRKKMLADGRKRIHAYAEGRLLDWTHVSEQRDLVSPGGMPVFYDPFRFPNFVSEPDHLPVHVADRVFFGEQGATVSGAPGASENSLAA